MKAIRKAPEVEIIKAVTAHFELQGFQVRCEIPSPWGDRHRLDLLAYGSGLIAVSAKVAPSIAALEDAARWWRGASFTYLAAGSDGRSDVQRIVFEAACAHTGVGLLLVRDGQVRVTIEARHNPSPSGDPPGSDLDRAAARHGSKGILTQGGSAGGRVLKPADVLAEELIERVRNGSGPISLSDELKDPGLQKRVAAAINARHARHAGVMARKWGEGFLVMRR